MQVETRATARKLVNIGMLLGSSLVRLSGVGEVWDKVVMVVARKSTMILCWS